MTVRDELRDPWTYVLGGIAAGVGWAVGLPAAAFLGIGAVVAGVKTASGALLVRRPALPPPPAPLPATDDTPEARWLERAESAAAALRRLAASIPDEILSERSRSMAEQASATLDGLRRLAGQASTTREVASASDPEALRDELTRLQRRREGEQDPEIADDLDSSISSVRDQIEISGRLERSLAQILARIESGALALERLVAQLGEILAMSGSGVGDRGAAELEQLTDELEGLRAGLRETEAVSRRALRDLGQTGTVEGRDVSDPKG